MPYWESFQVEAVLPVRADCALKTEFVFWTSYAAVKYVVISTKGFLIVIWVRGKKGYKNWKEQEWNNS